jgi:hemin uptake protein HemP
MSANASVPRALGNTPQRLGTVVAPLASICSSKLLAGQSCVAIEHAGTRYVLRATRAGKLILTK